MGQIANKFSQAGNADETKLYGQIANLETQREKLLFEFSILESAGGVFAVKSLAEATDEDLRGQMQFAQTRDKCRKVLSGWKDALAYLRELPAKLDTLKVDDESLTAVYQLGLEMDQVRRVLGDVRGLSHAALTAYEQVVARARQIA